MKVLDMPGIRRRIAKIAAMAGVLLAVPASGFSETYYISASAAPGGMGTKSAPWASADDAFRSGKLSGGDRLLFADGSYGILKINNWRFDKPVELVAPPRSMVHFDGIQVSQSENVIFRNLKVWPSAQADNRFYLVRALANSSKIVFDGLDVRTRKNVGNYFAWPKQKWLNPKVSGILVESSYSTVSNSILSGIYHGIIISGDHDKMLNNRVHGFGGDGTRAIGDFNLVRGNDVRDCFKIDDNHDDGFQTWSRGPDGAANQGTVRNLTVEGNIIQEWTGPANHPLQCQLQGIFMGGFLDDLVIRNNVISASAYHGITGYGITRGSIVNNTIVNSRGPSRQFPWIGVWGYKERGSRQVTVANNAAPYFNVNSGGNANDPRMHNLQIPYPAQVLRNPFGGDYRPKAGSPLIDGGTALFAPPTDIQGTVRNLGRAPDIGAYEVQ